MKKPLTFILLFFPVLLLFIACTPGQTGNGAITADSLYQISNDSLFSHLDQVSDTITIKYAKGLKVEYKADGIHVTISNPDPTAHHAKAEEIVISQPSSRFVCTTALQLGNFEILGLEDRIVGINSLKNIFDAKIKQQMADGSTVTIGKEGNFDLESVIAARPDYIFVSASKHGGFEALKDCGIPLISHHGYKETNPLGQAEWIKFIGLLTGEPRRANAVFADIERKYLTLKNEVAQAVADTAQTSSTRPTVMSGRQLRDGWYIVGGQSYMAQIFSDAGADYIMKDNAESGGTTLDFEAAYARAADAEFWQTDGSHDGEFSLADLREEDARYADLSAYRDGKVIFCNLSLTPYRELSPVEPHLILADFVKAFHPDILPHYQPKYYKMIK